MNLVGNLLIAPPAVKGSVWYKSVVMVTEEHSDGNIGIIINKRSQLSLKDFGEQLGFEITLPGFVYIGGPLNAKSLTFIHTPEWVSKNTMKINHEFSLSSADDILPRLSLGDTPKQWRLFLGVCGWGEGQLACEINGIPPYPRNTSWCTCKSDTDLVFGSDNKDQWCNALDRSGLEFAQNALA